MSGAPGEMLLLIAQLLPDILYSVLAAKQRALVDKVYGKQLQEPVNVDT